VFASVLLPLRATAIPQLRVTGIELLSVRATSRTVWLIVRLRTDGGLEGLGEASDAFGFANTTAEDTARMRAQLAAFCNLIDGRSPFEIESYRQRGEAMARQGLVAATAFGAIGQALWDLAGKTRRAVACPARRQGQEHSSRLRQHQPRHEPTHAGWLCRGGQTAVADGFRAIKAAPWDGFPPPSSPENAVARAVDSGIAAVAAMREAVGAQIAIMVECHSFFDVERAVRVAERLEPYTLTWYEEPVAPEQVEDTLAIRRRIRQPMAGGETLFGLSGFAPLVRRRAVDTIMPDVKHCGGLLELTRIAAMAADEGVMVAPHNPRR
jgi:galactonate dehydratase